MDQNPPKKGFHHRGNSNHQQNNQGNQNRQDFRRGEKPYRPDNRQENRAEGQQSQGQNQRPDNRQENRPGQNRNQGGGHHRRPHHHHRHHHNNHHNHRQDFRNKGGVDAIYDKYLSLLEDYLSARRKYFELFNKSQDANHKRKLDDQMNRTLDALRNYEKNLLPWQKEFFEKRNELYKFDTTYSENKGLYKVPETKPGHGQFLGISDQAPEAPYTDPHINQAQLQRPSFKEDNEESVGTIEDYIKIKGSK